MPYCKYCGSEVTDTDVFCAQCGGNLNAPPGGQAKSSVDFGKLKDIVVVSVTKPVYAVKNLSVGLGLEELGLIAVAAAIANGLGGFIGIKGIMQQVNGLIGGYGFHAEQFISSDVTAKVFVFYALLSVTAIAALALMTYIVCSWKKVNEANANVVLGVAVLSCLPGIAVMLGGAFLSLLWIGFLVAGEFIGLIVTAVCFYEAISEMLKDHDLSAYVTAVSLALTALAVFLVAKQMLMWAMGID